MLTAAHKRRLITAAALLVVLLLGIAFGGWLLRLLLLVASTLCLYEFLRLFDSRGLRSVRTLSGLVLGALVLLLQAGGPLWAGVTLGVCFVVCGIAFLCDFSGSNATLADYAPLVLGIVYVPFLLGLALYCSPAEQCLILAATIASDTGAYYTGSSFGRHKLFAYAVRHSINAVKIMPYYRSHRIGG